MHRLLADAHGTNPVKAFILDRLISHIMVKGVSMKADVGSIILTVGDHFIELTLKYPVGVSTVREDLNILYKAGWEAILFNHVVNLKNEGNKIEAADKAHFDLVEQINQNQMAIAARLGDQNRLANQKVNQ